MPKTRAQQPRSHRHFITMTQQPTITKISTHPHLCCKQLQSATYPYPGKAILKRAQGPILTQNRGSAQVTFVIFSWAGCDQKL